MPALLVQQQTDAATPPTTPPAQSNTTPAPRRVSNPTAKSKKEAPQAVKANAPVPKQPTPAPTQSQMKKLTRKSSKPIIDWFQRKLGGTVRARRASDGDALRARGVPGTRPTMKDRRRSSVPAVPPLPGAALNEKNNKTTKNPPRVSNVVTGTKRNTISLDGSDDFSSINDGHTIESSEDYRSSLARESLWSPNSLSVREADEDASVRPLPPSAPPSPSPSHSSSSYLSDPRTFASMAASTKPTTVLSVDLTGGMAHIAQAPPTPTIPAYRLGNHTRSHSTAPSTGGSITFSALPTAASPSPPSSSAHGPSASRNSFQQSSLQAPQHTAHHPRNNPRPSSPPLDDASVLTLASSAFGIPGARLGVGVLGGRRSVADDSISHFSGAAGVGDSTSHFLLGELDADDERLLEGDRDGDVAASLRALRPRSSRRGSWESEASGWSAHIGNGTGPPGTPSALRDRSVWTTGSLRTGTRSVNLTEEEVSPDKSANGHVDEVSSPTGKTDASHDAEGAANGPSAVCGEEDVKTPPANGVQSTPSSSTSTSNGDATGTSTPKREKSIDTPKLSSLTLEDMPPVLEHDGEHESDSSLPTPNQADRNSVFTTTTDAPTDVFVSAPSTPAAV